MQTPASVRNAMLVEAGVEEVALAPAFYLTRIQSDLNAVLQVIVGTLSEWWQQDTQGFAVRAPVNRNSMVMVNGSNAFTGGSIHEWMFDHTVIIAGDETRENRFVNATTLLHPYLGASGTRTAVVYFDCVQPTGEVMEILAPVKVRDGGCDLVPLSGQAALYARGATQAAYGTSERREVGRPTHYVVERFIRSGAIRPRLRLNKLPNVQMGLSVDLKMGPTEITDLTSQNEITLPLGWGDSVLLPLVKEKFSSFKHYTGDKGAAKTEAENARLVMGSIGDTKGHAENRVSLGRGSW